MMQHPLSETVPLVVARAIERATEHSGGPRLIPFTAAEVRFLQEVISSSLIELLQQQARRA